MSDNVISGNENGIALSGAQDVQHNVFKGNLIGTDKTGTVNLGNLFYGMSLGGAIGNVIGGTGAGEGNVIAFNGWDGIYVTNGSKQDQITQNTIFGNGHGGIDSQDSSNPSANFSPLTFTPGAGSNGTLAGTLTATPNEAYVVEIFSNPSAPAAGHEQGKTFVQKVTVQTDGSGNGTFSVTEPNSYLHCDGDRPERRYVSVLRTRRISRRCRPR